MLAEGVELGDIVSDYRRFLFKAGKKVFIQDVEEIIGRKISSTIFDIAADENSALCLIIMEPPAGRLHKY